MKNLWLEGYEDILERSEMELLEDHLVDEYGYHGVESYYYDPGSNILTDSEGYIVSHIYSIVSPGQWFLFKYKKETVLIKNNKGVLIELYWQDK
jgi:hypothetical protein